MSTLEPDDDILAAMEAQMADVQEPKVNSVTEIPSHELAGRLKTIDAALSAMNELMEKGPGTEKGRQLHSERNALLIEMRRRGLR